MNLFLIRLPYFFACCFNLYLISIPESDPIPDTRVLPDQPFYIWNRQIRCVNLPVALGILLTFQQTLLQPLHDTIFG